MNFIKKNLKVVISFIIGVLLASGITVYATSYLAKDISYSRDGTEINNVQDALNDLYAKSKTNFNYDTIYYNAYYSNYNYDYTITEENAKYKTLMIISYSQNVSISSSPAFINITNDNIVPILNPDYMEYTEYGDKRLSSDIYVGIINNPTKDDIIKISSYYSGQILILGIK